VKLRLTPRAESELVEIASYLVVRNPRAARRVEDALQEGVRRFAMPRYPYLIFYGIREAEQIIDVYAVRHAARQEEE
jgi:toxin ParE1/3/4